MWSDDVSVLLLQSKRQSSELKRTLEDEMTPQLRHIPILFC